VPPTLRWAGLTWGERVGAVLLVALLAALVIGTSTSACRLGLMWLPPPIR
jgi:hypothetical protein